MPHDDPPPPARLALTFSPPAAAQIHDRIYPAPTAPLRRQDLPADASLMQVVTADGLTLTGIEVAGRPDRPVLFVFHGNGSAAGGTIAWFRPLIAEGYGVVAAEYRGYSGNLGRASETAPAAAADAFYARAKVSGGPAGDRRRAQPGRRRRAGAVTAAAARCRGEVRGFGSRLRSIFAGRYCWKIKRVKSGRRYAQIRRFHVLGEA